MEKKIYKKFLIKFNNFFFQRVNKKPDKKTENQEKMIKYNKNIPDHIMLQLHFHIIQKKLQQSNLFRIIKILQINYSELALRN